MGLRRQRLPAIILGGMGILGAALGGCQDLLGFEHGTRLQDTVLDPCMSSSAPNCDGGTEQGGTAGSVGLNGIGGSNGVGGSSGQSAGGSAQGGGGANGGGANGGGANAAGLGGDEGLGGEGGAAGDGTGECQHEDDCTAPESPHCIVRCEPSDSGSRCVVHAADADEDDHGSAACTISPGDDCDDTRDDVYPLAEELCDGIDNDCDDASDFEDGHVLSGTVTVLATGQLNGAAVDVAWSPTAGAYGLVWSASLPYFQAMTLGGELPLPPVLLTEDTTNTVGVAIEWGSDAFGVAWDQDFVYFRTVGPDTTLGSDPLLVPDEAGFGSFEPALAWLEASQVWALFWQDYRNNTSQSFWRTVSPVGDLGSEFWLGELASVTGTATIGDTVAGVWNRYDYEIPGDVAEGGIFPTPSETFTPLTLEGRGPMVAAGTAGFGVVTEIPPDKLEFVLHAPDGSVVCGPVRTDAEGFVPTDMVAAGDGFVMFSGKPNVQALEVLANCQFGRRITIDAGVAREARAAAAGDEGFAVVWTEFDPVLHVNTALKARTFGRHFCD